MKINKIWIYDMYGTRSFSLEPKTVTRIKGANGTGKSSIIWAIQSLFAGGCDPSQVRHGCKQGEVGMLLEDGTSIKKTIKQARGGGWRAELEILDPSGQPVPEPQTFINRLSKAVAVDPSMILKLDTTTAAGRKGLSEILLSVMNLEFTPAEIIDAFTGQPADKDSLLAYIVMPSKPLSLAEHKRFTAEIAESRRKVGQTRKDAEGSMNRLRAAVGNSESTDHAAALREAKQYQEAVRIAFEAAKTEIESDSNQALADESEQFAKDVQAIDAEIEGKIEALRKSQAEQKAMAVRAHEKVREEIRERATNKLRAVRDEAAPHQEQAAKGLAVAEERAAQAHRAEVLREELKHAEEVYHGSNWRWGRLGDVITNLDRMRAKKLETAPLPGLEISEDGVKVDGVDWANVNTAKRIEIAMAVSSMLSGDVSFMLLDDAEHLSPETMEALERGMAEAGFQLIETIVPQDRDQPLSIETVEIPVAN
jgi:hypothetical protein